MRKLLVKLVQILDGTPSEYGRRRSGQSVVELALITPILIVLFSGMVEIGWFANNYLTLLDVTRAGARRAATLQDVNSPLSWDNKASYMPIEMLPPEFQALRIGYHPYSSNPTDAETELYARSAYRPSDHPAIPFEARSSGCAQFRGFYNEVICIMQSSLDPLVLNPENGVDDIIVSGFSIELVNPTGSNFLGPNRPIAGNVPQMVVVGRYPTNANECDAVETAPGSNVFNGSMDPRDPFDFNENLRIDVRTDVTNDPSLTYPFIWNANFSEIYPGYDEDQVNLELREKQVGFVWYGQHRITVMRADGSELQTLCLGSQWSSAAVERMINLTGYVPETDPAEREMLPGTGLVLVEIHWQHEMLLKLPVFNPVFNIMSPDGEPPTIYVWAAFPLPATEPTILFQ